jgi:hypothetical protein
VPRYLIIFSSLAQWWNMVRPTATEPVLRVTTSGGLETGQSKAAGYVVRSPLKVPVDREPTLTINKVSCIGSEQPTELPPVFCRAGVNATLRSEKDGGRWTDGEYLYQVHDIAVINQGGRLVTDARLSIVHSPESALIQVSCHPITRAEPACAWLTCVPYLAVVGSEPIGLVQRVQSGHSDTRGHIPPCWGN